MYNCILQYNLIHFLLKVNYSVNSCGAIGNPTSNSKHNFAVAPWARQQVYVIHGQMLWPLGRDNACCVQQDSFSQCPIGVHMRVISQLRTKHASLGRHEKNVLPTSCKVIGIHLSPYVRGKRKRHGKSSLYSS